MSEMLGLDSLKPIKTTKAGNSSMEEEEEERPLSPMARLFHEPGFNVYIISMIGFKTIINVDVIKSNAIQTLIRQPRFSSLQVVDKENGGMKWIPTKVDIDNHVIVPMLEQDIQSPENFLEDYVANLSKTSIEISKPMWDIHILNIKTSDAEGTCVLRLHHSLGDGMSLIALLLEFAREDSKAKTSPILPIMKESSYIKFTEFWSIFRMIWNTFVGIIMLVLTLLFLSDTKTPLKGTQGVENRPRRFVRRSVSLQDIKFVKNEMKMTVNDVVFGITQCGLSKYLNRRYEVEKKDDSAEKKKSNFLSKSIRLRATFFFNLRSVTKIDAFADMMKNGTKNGRWGNKIGFGMIPFSISLPDDPLDHLKQAKTTMDRAKASFEPFCTYLLVKLIIKFLGIKAAGKLSHKLFFNTTLFFTNLPGPQQEVAVYGHQVAYIAPSCYGQPVALLIHVVSYVDKLTFVISADEQTIPDPHRLCDDIEESLHLIKASVLEKFA